MTAHGQGVHLRPFYILPKGSQGSHRWAESGLEQRLDRFKKPDFTTKETF
jgi:hypothetical protein